MNYSDIKQKVFECTSKEERNNITDKLAVQLYSVRELLSTDLEGTIKKLSEIGYVNVQVDGLRGVDIHEFKRVLDKYGMNVVGLHIKHERFFNDIDGIIKESKIFDCKMIFDKYIEEEDQNTNGYRKTKFELLKVASMLYESGFRVGLHNPEYDLKNHIDEMNVMDFICKPVNGLSIFPEIDTYWITVNGYDPVKYINNYHDRLPIIHMKDILPDIDIMDYKKNICACGQGYIDFKSIVIEAEKGHVEYYVVEQDCDARGDIIDALEFSYKYLENIGVEIYT